MLFPSGQHGWATKARSTRNKVRAAGVISKTSPFYGQVCVDILSCHPISLGELALLSNYIHPFLPMKPQIHTTPRPKGFALVVTVSLLVLLSVIALGFLSLSAVTLRSGSHDKPMEEARANARLALQIAIGELQKQTGADTRVTASASIVDETYPSVLGVWRSWEGTNHDPNGRPIAPAYSEKDQPEASGGRFLNWLVSSSANNSTPGIGDAPALVQTSAGTNTVPLLAGGSLLPTDTRQVHVVPTKLEERGNYAWWISGENQKARLAQPYHPRTATVAGLTEMGQSHTITNPEVFGLPGLLDDPELHNPDGTAAKPARKALSRQTMALLRTDNPVKPEKRFHDLTNYSTGLLTNTATGGWRKDMSLLTERWDQIYAAYPGGRLPLFRYSPSIGATSLVPKPVKPNPNLDISTTGTGFTAVTAATPNQSNLYPWSNYSNIVGSTGLVQLIQPNTYQAASASWQSLVSFATSYKNFSINSGVVESPFVWDIVTGNNATWMGTSNAKVINLYNYKHVQRLHPQIARFQALIYARAVPVVPPTNPARYNLRLMLVPIVTLWNPYDVGLTIGPLTGVNEELLIGWTRSMPINLATVRQSSYPGGPSTVPNSQFRYISPGNFQYFDVNGNFNNAAMGDGYDTQLSQNVQKGYPGNAYMDIRAFGASFPSGKLTFKPGEARVFSPRFPGHIHWSGSVRLGEGFNHNNILGFEFGAQNNRLGSELWWFLMKNDRLTKPYRGRNPGLGFAMSFGTSSGGYYQSHPSHVGVQRQRHNLVTLAAEPEGNAYWPPSDVDEIGYSIAELANGPWVPLFSVNMGPRTTIGTGPGTKQSRPTKGALQSNPLASMSLVDPISGDPKAHPANGTFDITYHSMSANSTLTPNVSTSRGFIATGYQSGDGLSRLLACDIPLRPMASLVELQGWNPRGNNPYPPFQYNLIGNSDATPLIPKDQIVPPTLSPDGVDKNLMHDDAYCANHLLFDDWFLSTIAPDPTGFGNNSPTAIDQVYRDFLQDKRALVNRAYRPIGADSKLSDAEATARIAQIINHHEGWLKSASRFQVEGMFNVNSTSVEAWKALLGHAKSHKQIAMQGADQIVAEDVSGKHVVTRGAIATDIEAGTGAGFGGQFANASEYTGFRSLTDDQIGDLATKIVEQVRLRGPFLSLAEFVNRHLAPGDSVAMAGAVQTALNNLSLDPMAELRKPANFLSDTTMAPGDPKMNGVGYEYEKAAEGDSAYGVPGWIRQADVLRPIAPILSARDDTFTIRAYGDVRDATGKVIARAWCEAVVSRTRDFVNEADAADSINPPSTRTTHAMAAATRWFPFAG
jgi:hypothetical protein